MDFKKVIQTCLDFSIANGGTIQSFAASDGDKLVVHSRRNRTEILIERDMKTPDAWQAQQLQNAAGEKMPVKEIVSTEEQLLEYLSCFWDLSETHCSRSSKDMPKLECPYAISLDALHSEIIGIREEFVGIRGEITCLREAFHGMCKKIDAILLLVKPEANL
jgi:hypothetical protein